MKRLAILLTALAFMAGFSASAGAQGLVTTTPLPITSVISNGSVSITNSFKLALAASATRRGCILQNTSANTMYVYVGDITAATTAASITLPTKTTFNCSPGGIVMTDQLSVTGTAGDSFTTVRQ